MKKILVGAMVFFICSTLARAENLNAYMMDLLQRERGNLTNVRKREIITAFQQCTDAEVKKVFIENNYYEENSNNGQGTYVIQDSLKWAFRVKHCLYTDVDDDAQKEIFFHEKDPYTGLQLSVLLKKNGSGWEVIYREHGVFSSLLFEGRMLRGITTVELHQYANPCDVFKLYKVAAAEGKTTVTPRMKVHVPHLYHYPVKFEEPKHTVTITSDTLYFYHKTLYSPMNFPYKKEILEEFKNEAVFNSHESQWFDLVPSAIYWAGFIESRGSFSSLLLAFNPSYLTGFPEYLFVYVPNGQFTL